ncbi:DUF4870 domain-containing protein [Sunxiuqinia rutila]|uniref:DUF4870 domain-containing protein n=1 Tax=Sunxiuqinia rutila TaxID=1397841 RepID=UPI003D3669B9
MKNNDLARRVKLLRSRKGFSQELLAENSGLSLRTIQRMENGETEPRGDTLKRLAHALDVSSDEIMDWTIEEDRGFLTSLNLSALSFILFPLLGILVPLILWISKKDKIKDVDQVARNLLNFQISWSMFLFLGLIGNILLTQYRIHSSGDINMAILMTANLLNIGLFGLTYFFNLTLVIINTIRIQNEKATWYFPKIRFLR